MRRWSSNLLCGLSLLIFLLAMGIWVRSYYVADVFRRLFHGSDPSGTSMFLTCYTFRSGDGTVYLWRQANRFLGDNAHRALWLYEQQPPSPNLVGNYPNDVIIIPFRDVHLRYRIEGQYLNWEAIIPLWLFGLFAIPPLLWVRRSRRKRGRGFPVLVAQALAPDQ